MNRPLSRLALPAALLALMFAGAVFAAPAPTTAAKTPPVLQPTAVHADTALATAKLLSRYHYQAKPLDDAMSAQIFERYLKAIDPNRSFFLQADIDEFASARTTLDDAIYERRLDVPFAIFARHVQRVSERMKVVREILAAGFDFSVDESYVPDRADAPWAQSAAELREIWRKRIKNDWLRLKLAGQKAPEIRATLIKRYEHALDRTLRVTSDDVFQLFMNAWASALEPHTSYFGPRAAEDFSISMKLSLVGIGAVLQERDDYVTVRELIAGGPAILSGKVAVGDRIVGVAQGKGPIVDISGWRVTEAVDLIRGAPNTTVVLDILPAGADTEHRLVTLVRDKIQLEQQAASSSVIEAKTADGTHRIGVIKLPSFYQDVEARRSNPQFRSATRDVSRLIEGLKRDKVEALIVDLRNNVGGSLDEAVSLTGLFIDTGPVVIQHNGRGAVRVENDTISGMDWEGPLGVLINRASASAAEIFAAAIQDYGRGIVLGEDSFGKGTVQTLLNLDERTRKPRYGELKITIAQFFRITGSTTQLRGVTPDIALPSFLDTEHFGESSYDNPLPWSRLPAAASYHPVGNITALLPALNLRHERRAANDSSFRQFSEEANELKALRQRKTISLNEAVRRAERTYQMTHLKSLLNPTSVEEGESSASGEAPVSLEDDGLLANERSLSAELAAEKARKAARDVLLNESAAILGDMVELLQSDPALARRGAAPGIN
ncbi:tail-specific protease [Betaproteobacteria bacterium]|nr:tail-specific protease [Betaproteobacteria bacterium]GHT91665.1 tail-specific protease [Betaproteobacteria bacterium]GHU20255.1 tail-specific protease [Betaproteobacteria bacterium]GHU28407.1 tail-specific protease [Betaproteobacteria bacterium]